MTDFPTGTPLCSWLRRLAAAKSAVSPRQHLDVTSMRLVAVLITFACLGACSTTPAPSEQALVRDDMWRQKQAVLDAEAIMRGMTQAQEREAALARSAR